MNPNGMNDTIPILCLCQQYSVCGCDDNNNSTYIDSILGNGSLADLNSTVARVSNVNGTKTLVLNATLPNGTTASGGTENANAGTSHVVMENLGWWVMCAVVASTVWLV
jgi:hypothetical protein